MGLGIADCPNHNESSTQSAWLPNFLLTNAQTIVNKLEEAEIIFEQQQVDIGIIIKSWFSSKIPENYVNIPSSIFFPF